jgi:hypothetical protein
MNLMKTAQMLSFAIAALYVTSTDAYAQEAKTSPTYTAPLNQDKFFGFDSSFIGLMPVSDIVNFNFYGTFWTKPAFEPVQNNSGDDL